MDTIKKSKMEWNKKCGMFLMLGFIICRGVSLKAQEYDPEYVKVTNERAAKIVKGMDIVTVAKQEKVTQLIAEQYRSLSSIQDGRDAAIEQLKEDGLPDDKVAKKTEKLKNKASNAIGKLHKNYVKKLKRELTDEQIVQVKDGMTYGVVPITYTGYLDMLSTLTDVQKKTIYDHLVEAREHAMDAGSSDEKHAWFGEYKGRINNYLSAEGYDLSKESKAWHHRLEVRKKNEANQ